MNKATRVMLVRLVNVLISCTAFTACGGSGGPDAAVERPDLASLGEKIFDDTNLSNPPGQACASCHEETVGFSDPRGLAASPGAVPGKFGTRNSPSLAYSLYSPEFGFSNDEQDFVGGLFWDGAARNLEEQVSKPLLGQNEMNNGSINEVVSKIEKSSYAEEFRSLFGQQIFSTPNEAFRGVASALAAYENTDEFRPFTSKYDYYLANQVKLTESELRGLAVFTKPNKGNCAACHLTTGPDGESPQQAVFTDFTYDNIGLPKNSSVNKNTDIGLQTVTGRPSDRGRFKVPTLRNVAVTAPYFHNGVFNTLEEAVHFYNARDVDPTIAKPEVPETMNIIELGNLGLSPQEEKDLVDFMRTLTDGFKP